MLEEPCELKKVNGQMTTEVLWGFPGTAALARACRTQGSRTTWLHAVAALKEPQQGPVSCSLGLQVKQEPDQDREGEHRGLFWFILC